MNSFISWIGGKKALRKIILEQFPESGSFDRYIEVFGGAAWVLFGLEKPAKFEVYNDVNGELVNLFRCVKYHPNALQEELKWILISREQFYNVREGIGLSGFTDIQRAARFFILVKESYGSALHSFGMMNNNLQNAVEYLNEVSARLNRTVIDNLDFEQLITLYDRESSLFYLDPPYFSAEKLYKNKFTKDDHIRLKQTLNHIKGKFILSYNDCKEVKNLYKDYNIIEIDRSNSLVNKIQSQKYLEVIIKNY